ncbi:Glutaredoxin protein 5 [Paragonimus heterotremus]|uniref:Glutaredoxin-related protein 5, mitochondrial n=1 Tax=Paragonimus heterotremus TaxID=100268 RepID=A0A8J4WUY2_9TREM|nr:Glutaredoxin protein 5 [Paragonimus heterotremus]
MCPRTLFNLLVRRAVWLPCLPLEMSNFSRFTCRTVGTSVRPLHTVSGLPVRPNNSIRQNIVLRAYCSTEKSDPVQQVGHLVRSNRVVVFMKGDPDEPRCGFSNAVCRILEMHGILDKAKSGECPNLFASYDVLQNEELRSAAKTYADWPTFPQVYFDGEFVGGCDILLEMHRTGKLAEELERLKIGSAMNSQNPNSST